MLANILPGQPLRSVTDTGSFPALTQAQLGALTGGAAASGGISFGGTGYGPNLCTGGIATASDQYSALYDAPKASDGNQGSWWESSGNPPHWWKCQFASPKAVTKVRLLLGHTLGLKDFTVEGSNDNQNWTVLYTGQAAQSTAWQEFTFANAAAYQFVRLNGGTVWVAANSFRFVEAEMMESLQGSLNVLVDATGGGSVPVREIRYHTTETDAARVTVKSSADGVSYATHAVMASGGGFLTAAVGTAVRYVSIVHPASVTQTAYEVEILAQRCAAHAAGRYHVLAAAARPAAAAYHVGGKLPVTKNAAARYGIYQPMNRAAAARYHVTQPAVRRAFAFYHLLVRAEKVLHARYHLRPPVPLLLNGADGAVMESIVTGLLKGGAAAGPATLHLWNERGGGNALKMGNVRITAALAGGGYAGGNYPQGAEFVTGKWIGLKSSGVLGTGAIDDAQPAFTPVGGNPGAGGLAVGPVPANAGRVISMRIDVPAAPHTPYSATPRLDIVYDAFADPGFGGNFGHYFGG